MWGDQRKLKGMSMKDFIGMDMSGLIYCTRRVFVNPGEACGLKWNTICVDFLNYISGNIIILKIHFSFFNFFT